MADGWGIGRAEADNIGMLGTVMNALMLRGALTARTETDVRIMTANPMQSVAEPFIRLRAISHLEQGRLLVLAGGIGQPYVTTDYPSVQRALELEADALLVARRDIDAVYDKDPNAHVDATRLDRLTYAHAVARSIKVMDTSAFVLASEQVLGERGSRQSQDARSLRRDQQGSNHSRPAARRGRYGRVELSLPVPNTRATMRNSAR